MSSKNKLTVHFVTGLLDPWYGYVSQRSRYRDTSAVLWCGDHVAWNERGLYTLEDGLDALVAQARDFGVAMHYTKFGKMEVAESRLMEIRKPKFQ